MNIGIFAFCFMAVLGIIAGIYRAMEIFAETAERECAKRRRQ